MLKSRLGLETFSEILVSCPETQTKHVNTIRNWRDRERKNMSHIVILTL